MHCVVIGNDGLVYVCDRLGDRVEVFDKMGNFKRNIVVQTKTAHRANSENTVGTAGSIGFSPDPAQTFMYVANGSDNVIHILDRTTGEVLSKFGRPGNQPGDLTDPHSIAVNSKGDIIIGEVPYGGKLQMWRAVRAKKLNSEVGDLSEESEAAKEIAKTAGKAVDAVAAAGRFFDKVMGNLVTRRLWFVERPAEILSVRASRAACGQNTEKAEATGHR